MAAAANHSKSFVCLDMHKILEARPSPTLSLPFGSADGTEHMTDTTSLLAGKIAIITGAGAGMGQAGAPLFAAEGATVIAADIAHSAGIEEDGAILRCRLDVGQEADWAELTNWIGQRFSKLDILVNNAGIHRLATLLD